MIDIDKCMDWWKNNRAEYKCNMGNKDGTDAEEELINTLYAEVKRLRKGIIDIADKWEQPSIIRGFLKELKEMIE